MNPATEIGTKEAVERFARLSEAEQAAVMARGRQIRTVDDLKDLPAADAARLRPIIEAQALKP